MEGRPGRLFVNRAAHENVNFVVAPNYRQAAEKTARRSAVVRIKYAAELSLK